ncbi:hypothetical protein C1J01_47965, partial [Nonomuraea aridisoli]
MQPGRDRGAETVTRLPETVMPPVPVPEVIWQLPEHSSENDPERPVPNASDDGDSEAFGAGGLGSVRVVLDVVGLPVVCGGSCGPPLFQVGRALAPLSEARRPGSILSGSRVGRAEGEAAGPGRWVAGLAVGVG